MAPGRLRIGTVQVLTGNGKGKTTSALGCGLRAAGRGLNVLMLQFMKGRVYGELEAVKHVPRFEILQFGRDEFVDKDNPAAEDKELARIGFKKACEAVGSGQYDMVILDEVNIAVDYGLVGLEELLDLVEGKPSHVELILTGRYAHPEIQRVADTVTEMLDIKHHFASGIEAREGIEY
ncbi:MAG: cob(I)yrinic acid a,c-diamide adenosyltransferase [Candidatus Eisenbacteria bacterium]|nr:cob(I)yrinic acid a,c-diamide adenosyltransferase [Candidatus Eisenbacteria bacterium]